MRFDPELSAGGHLPGDTEAYGARSNWRASLNLGFVRRGEKTVLAERLHQGPLRVQRPFYPEGGLCHVYLLHPPGGVVAGDSLSIRVNAGCGAECLLTTPGAGKFYRSIDRQAHQCVDLSLDADAVLEWLPQKTIVFEGARLASSVNVSLAENARFIGWEILALGRPAAGEGFEEGSALLNWRILRCGEPLLIERTRLNPAALKAVWGLNGRPVCGAMYAAGANANHLEQVRALIGGEPGRGVTLIDDVLICRAYDAKAAPVRRFFEAVRRLIRRDVAGYEPSDPRIWAT